MIDTVRVLRIIEYVGPREWVEEQVRNSLHGTKEFRGGRNKYVDKVGRITAVTLGEFAESIAELDVSNASKRNNQD